MIQIDLGRFGKAKLNNPTPLEIVALIAILVLFVLLLR